MENALLQQILRDTYTTLELHRRIELLKTYLTNKYFANEESMLQNVDGRDRDWLATFVKTPIEGLSKNNVTRVMSTVAQSAKEIQALILFIPINLPADEIILLGKRARSNFGEHTILEIRVDPLLIGGMALSWKGVYKDYSIRQKIKDQRDGIIRSFQKYVR